MPRKAPPQFQPAKLAKLRRDAGLTQIELSRKAGLGDGTVGNIEAGQQKPRFETVWALAHALGVDVADLMAD